MIDEGDDYHARVTTAVTKATFDASLIDVDGQQTAYICTAETCEALISVFGFLMEGAPNCQTPQGMRKIADAVGKNALIAMRNARAVRETTGKEMLG